MSVIRYDKLIRDRIPEIISKTGKKAVTEVIPESEIKNALDRKLMEEVQEYLESDSEETMKEELADVLEVLHGIASSSGISWDKVEKKRIEKREERGGFEKGLRLLEVRDKEL